MSRWMPGSSITPHRCNVASPGTLSEIQTLRSSSRLTGSEPAFVSWSLHDLNANWTWRNAARKHFYIIFRDVTCYNQFPLEPFCYFLQLDEIAFIFSKRQSITWDQKSSLFDFLPQLIQRQYQLRPKVVEDCPLVVVHSDAHTKKQPYSLLPAL